MIFFLGEKAKLFKNKKKPNNLFILESPVFSSFAFLKLPVFWQKAAYLSSSADAQVGRRLQEVTLLALGRQSSGACRVLGNKSLAEEPVQFKKPIVSHQNTNQERTGCSRSGFTAIN